MLQSHRIEVLTNTGGVWKKKWRRWAFYGLQRPLERRFLGKTRTFRPNELPQGFEILQRLGTQLLSLNPKKLQILVWDFEPLFKVTSGSLGSATGVSKKRTYFIPRTKMQQDLRNGCPVVYINARERVLLAWRSVERRAHQMLDVCETQEKRK